MQRRDLFLSCSWDDSIKLYSIHNPGSMQTFLGHSYCVYHVAWWAAAACHSSSTSKQQEPRYEECCCKSGTTACKQATYSHSSSIEQLAKQAAVCGIALWTLSI
jgi:hypothetical protein